MSFHMEDLPVGTVPRIRCDFCKNLIMESNGKHNAIVLFDTKEGSNTPIFLHKGKCDDSFSDKSELSQWIDLNDFLYYLYHNFKAEEPELDKFIKRNS